MTASLPPHPPPSECLDPPLNLNGVKQSCVSVSQRSAPFNKIVLDLGPLHMSPVDRAGSVTGMNFALGSYEKFQPGFRDEKRSKILGTSSGAKFGKQSKHSETQKF